MTAHDERNHSGRTVLVGDVHGCADELEALLDRIGFSDGDRLCFVGDLVVRGPAPRRVLALARKLQARAVRGNHEHRLINRLETGLASIDTMTNRTARQLTTDDWRYLRELPLWLDLPEHDVRIVHAGVMPDIPITRQREADLLHLRSVTDDGRPVLRRDEGTLWGALYTGPPHIVFGHHAVSDPQFHPWATGLDTGCVYGGALTALVLGPNEHIAPIEHRSAQLVQQPAHRTYANV